MTPRQRPQGVSSSLQGPIGEGGDGANPRPDWIGAGEGNRTLTTSLEGWSSTIELLPRGPERLVGGGGFEPPKRVAQLIYSQPPLAARAPTQTVNHYTVIHKELHATRVE